MARMAASVVALLLQKKNSVNNPQSVSLNVNLVWMRILGHWLRRAAGSRQQQAQLVAAEIAPLFAVNII